MCLRINICRLFSFIFIQVISVTLVAQTVPGKTPIDIKRYMGTWYEIASVPSGFRKGCHCTTADYELLPSGDKIRMLNRCIKFKNGRSKLTEVKGIGFPLNKSDFSRLKIRFFWPSVGEYNIMAVNDDYTWAVVTSKKNKNLRILSRDSFMPAHTYNSILDMLKNKGIEVAVLKKTPRNCDIGE